MICFQGSGSGRGGPSSDGDDRRMSSIASDIIQFIFFFTVTFF